MGTKRIIGKECHSAVALLLLLMAGLALVSPRASHEAASLRVSDVDSPRLIAVHPFSPPAGNMCEWEPATAQQTLAAALSLEQNRAAAREAVADPRELDLAPIRSIQEEYATYSAVAVDDVRDEIVLQDENLFQILVYDRKANTPLSAKMTEPKRIIAGPKTKVEFNCGLYIDPASGDIYSVNNDTTDDMVIFDRSAKGDVAPIRELHTPHGSYGIAVDEVHQEMFFTVEHDNALVAYKKSAAGEDQPLRMVQGDHTLLADPPGIAIDPQNNWLFVVNHGSMHRVQEDPQKPSPPNWPLTRSYAVPGSGESWPPSITVFDRTAQGDAQPLRVIQGPKT